MDIFNILKKEKESKKLVKLPENFYSEIANYISKRKKILEKIDENSEEAKKLKYEIENVTMSLEELYDIREKKILLSSLISAKENIEMVDQDILALEERILFNLVYKILKAFRRRVLNKIKEGESPEYKELSRDIEFIIKELKVFREKNVVLLRVLKDIPQFVGIDLKTYGPFNMEEIIMVPKDMARMLVDSGYVEEIKVEL